LLKLSIDEKPKNRKFGDLKFLGFPKTLKT